MQRIFGVTKTTGESGLLLTLLLPSLEMLCSPVRRALAAFKAAEELDVSFCFFVFVFFEEEEEVAFVLLESDGCSGAILFKRTFWISPMSSSGGASRASLTREQKTDGRTHFPKNKIVAGVERAVIIIIIEQGFRTFYGPFGKLSMFRSVVGWFRNPVISGANQSLPPNAFET